VPAGRPAPRKNRRGPARVLAVVAAVVVALVLGGVAVANLGDDDDPRDNASQTSGDQGEIDVIKPTGDLDDGVEPSTQPPDPPADEPAATTPPAGEATGPRIKYEILVAKPTKALHLSYNDKDGDSISYQGHALPWELEFVATDPNFNPRVSVQIRGGSGVYITCRLTIDGKLRTERTDNSKLYPTVGC
jgi:hypothetical protein